MAAPTNTKQRKSAAGVPQQMPPGKAGKDAKGRPQGARRSGGGRTGTALTLGMLGLVLAGLALPTFIVVAFGMLPSATALLTDRDPKRSLTFTVLPPNLFATMIELIHLWMQTNSVSQALDMAEDPIVWLAIYIAAGFGWGLHAAMPAIVNAFKETRLEAKRAELAETMRKLREEWGDAVGPEEEEAEEAAAAAAAKGA